MFSRLKRISMILVSLVFVMSVSAGCSKNDNEINNSSAAANGASTTTPSGNISYNTNSPNVATNISTGNSTQKDSEKELLGSIMKLAYEGKIINSEFPVKSTVIDTVEKKLGKTDKIDWVPEAKGNYATFSKYNEVFGFNKGSQIFEGRSFDSRLKKFSLSMVKKAYGTPAYDKKVNGEEIIGYLVGKEYKILLVFSNTSSKSDPLLDHYSVFYPRGTVNMMADDPGREW